MKTTHSLPLRTAVLLGLCLAAAFVSFHAFTPSAGAQDCQIPPRLPPNAAWPPGQTVNVYINPTGFTAAQLSTMRDTINSWSARNNNGVRLNISTTPVSGPYSYTIRQQTPGISAGAQGETGGTAVEGGYRYTAYSNINPGVTDLTATAHVLSHEIGHTFGLADCLSCSPSTSAMTVPNTPDLNAGQGSAGPTDCDALATQQIDTPPNNCRPTTCPSRYQFDVDTCRCVYAWEYTSEHRACPLIIDVEGDGFAMTDAPGGVFFDFDNNSLLEKISWTAADSDDAWLVLDRNGDGRINGGAELFGYTTPQPAPEPGEITHGFRALSVYDRPENGGDGNGLIDARDAVFGTLRLWQDKNHNAFSEPWELRPLAELGVESVSLNHKDANVVDAFGNRFILRARVKGAKNSTVGRWVWDVSLQQHNSNY